MAGWLLVPWTALAPLPAALGRLVTPTDLP